MKYIFLLVAHVLALAGATDCVPGSDSCDELTSMKVSMLQKKQINEHTHESETVSSLEERKAQIVAELESLDSELATLDETSYEQDEVEEEEDNSKAKAGYCQPDLIGRRRENSWEYGGRCSCRRRDGMSSTGLYGCKGSVMEYYGGQDADSRRRGYVPPPTRRRRRRRRQAPTTCNPDWIGRRRENAWENGGRCSCRRRDGMSSTGMYGCNGGRMEYYGGGDADSRRRR